MIPTLPPHVKSTYLAYAAMMDKVSYIARTNSLNPTAVLIVAFLGDRTMAPRDILAYDLTGLSNASYNLRLLSNQRLITRISDRADGRIRFVKLTDAGLRLCASIRQQLAESEERAAA